MIVYDDFESDWRKLPQETKNAFTSLINQIQRNPYGTDFQRKTEVSSNGEYFGYELPQGYIVYWRITHPHGILNTFSLTDIQIEILGIEKSFVHAAYRALTYPSMSIPLLVYDGFEDDWGQLPEETQAALAEFLEQLQKNPYEPGLQRMIEVGFNERFGYKLPKAYVVYWRVISTGILITSWDDNMKIQLLGIARDRNH